MLGSLFTHQWKDTFRSPVLTQSIVQTIILGLIALYFALSMLAIGYYFDKIIAENFPGTSVISKFNGLMLFYFLMDLFMRFFFQRFPALHIRPYLHLPIKKSTLVHYLLLKSIPSFFTWLPFFLIVPFFLKVVVVEYSMPGAVCWLSLMVLLILLNNFIAFYLSKSMGSKPYIAFSILLMTGIVFYLEMQGVLTLSDYFAQLIDQVIQLPVLLLVPLGLGVAMYMVVFRLLKSHAYLDQIDSGKGKEEVRAMEFGLASRFGKIGEEIELELKLIWRNARSRTFVYISLAFLFYPLILMNGEESPGVPLAMLIGIILTGAFMLNYAQLLLSWHSPHFDFILTQNISIRDFFMSRYYLLAMTNFILFVLSLPYLLFIPELGLINVAMFFYNTGVVIYIYMYFSNFNSKRIDPTKGGVFNMEGFGGAHYLIMIPIMLIPFLIYYFFKLLGYPMGGVWFIAALGLMGILFRDYIIDAIVAHFKSRKHMIAADFRKK